MPEQFVILCCGNIRPEVDAILATGTMPGAAARTYPFHCGRVPSVWETVREMVNEYEASGDTICLCGCGCTNAFDIPKDVMDRPSLALAGTGPQLFLPGALYDEFRRCGAYLVLPGWLSQWKQNVEHDGIDASTARDMFDTPVSAIVLLDTGLWPGIDSVLAEFSEFCGLAARTFPVGTDHLRFRLEALYRAWESGQAAKACRTTVSANREMMAGYATVADLTGSLIQIHDEQATIARILDAVNTLFSPEKSGFLPVSPEGPGEVISIPAGAYPDTGHFRQPSGSESCSRKTGNDSFLYPVRNINELIGIISVDRVAQPENLDEYITLAGFISQVAGLSIMNARTHHNLQLAMKARDMEISDRIRTEMALRESEERLQQKSQDLAVRVRQLDCLYEIARLVETLDSTEALLQAVAETLPSAWEDPDRTCAQVIAHGREFTSAAFRKTSRMQEAGILVRGRNIGKIGIFLQNGGREGNQPFLLTETALLSAVAERVGRVLERKEVEEELNESEEKYRILIESSFDGIAIHQEGILVYVNRTGARLMGSDNPDDFVGKPALDIVAPAFRKDVADRIRQSPGTALDLMREQFLRVDGSTIEVDVATVPSTWKGKPAAYVTFRDITAQVHAENALRESEEQFRVIFHNQQTGLLMVDSETHTIADANQSALTMIGLSRNEVIGKVCHQFICPAEKGQCPVTDLGRTVDHTERILIASSGKPIQILKSVNPVMIRGRTYLLESFIDITQRKRIEEALRESEEKYRAIINEIQDIFYRTDLAGTITMLSPSAATLAGYDSLDQLIGRPVSMVYANPADRDRLLAALQESGSVYAFPLDLKVRDGSIRHVTTSSHFYRDPQGNPAGIEGVIHDITNLRKAEDALRESEEKFRALVETTSDFIWEVDAGGRYTYVSPQVRNLLGFDPPEMIGKTPFDLMAPDEARRVRAEYERHVASRLPITALENQCRRKDGGTVVLETSGVPRYGKDGSFTGYRGIDRDITRRKTGEQALHESEERYRTIIENIQDVYFQIDGEDQIIMVSPSGAPVFGYASAGEMLGKPVQSLWKHPEQRPELLEAMKKQGGAVQDWEAEFVKSDGTPFWVSINAHLRTDSHGGFLGTEGIIRDMSERRKMEEALKNALTKLNMLSSITRHDILNQITGLRTFLELSKEDLKGTKHEMFIEKEDLAAEAIQRQIEFTKFYQDIGVNAPQWQNAEAVIREAAGQVSPTVDLRIMVKDVEIFADPLIVKVFFNLMENSLRHGEHVTQMSFSARKSVEGLIVTYRDNGAGISEEDKQKLFRKGFGKHTGLGLFLSREILAITGITITENGEPGKGVQFEMTVPYGAFRINPASPGDMG
jgi:PAS domain S-box-containing protein